MSGWATGISIGTALLSAGVGAYSAVEQSNAQKAQAEYQSDMAEYNAKVAEGNAQIAEDEGRAIKQQAYEDSLSKRQEAAQIVGRQRAEQAASGVQVDAGSALDLNLDTVEKGELDAMAIKEQGAWNDYNQRLQAWNYRSQGEALSTQSELYSNQASSYDPTLSVAGTLLSGVSSASKNIYELNKGSDYKSPLISKK